MKKTTHMLALLIAGIMLAGCSGNLPLFNDMRKGRSDKLERIEITPGAVTLQDKSFDLLTATGYYNDGSSGDLTSKCEWTCDDQKIAVVSSGGYLQARTLSGTANVTARYDALTSVVIVTVNINLVEITITPSATTLKSTNQIYFTATGKTSDGAFLDLTKTALWSVTPFDIAEIDTNGFFMARGTTGTVTVTAKSPDSTITSNAATVELDLTTLYVDAAFTTSAGEGTKEKPFTTINQAIERAESIKAIQINVAKGIYTEDIIIKSNISLYGGYTSNYTGAEWTRSATVVPSETKILAAGNTAILYQSGLTAATVVDGFYIEGGKSELLGVATLSTSAAIMCTNASPTIQNNEIYGGKSILTSAGILNQSASPVIRNNPIISGGLSDYAGGGADNYAILCQSFSSPIIEGNGSELTPSQVITGPIGGNSTYRIKCESSSNAMIKNNIIETTTSLVTKAKGILAISSSPIIQGNIIKAALPSNVVIRGENTSFIITDNSIEGSVYITSGSLNPVIDNNKIIKGNVTVTGSSADVSIRNNVNKVPGPDFKTHYGKSSKKIIEGQVLFSGGSTGEVNENTVNNVLVDGAGRITITNNFIISENGAIPVSISNDGYATIMYNYIQIIYSKEYIFGLSFINSSNYQIVTNNIVFVQNTLSTAAGNTIGMHLRYIETNAYIMNNIIEVRAPAVNFVYGVFLATYSTPSISLYNNIIKFNDGASRIAIYNDSTSFPYTIRSNYFINFTSLLYDKQGSNDCSTVDQLNLITTSWLGVYADNIGKTTAEFGSESYWIDYLDSRDGQYYIDNDFHIDSSSVLYHMGKTPYPSHATYISKDFDGNDRNVTDNNYSVGPYE